MGVLVKQVGQDFSDETEMAAVGDGAVSDTQAVPQDYGYLGDDWLDPMRFRLRIAMLPAAKPGGALMEVILEQEEDDYSSDETKIEVCPCARWTMKLSPGGDDWWGNARVPSFTYEMDKAASPIAAWYEQDDISSKCPYDALAALLTSELGTVLHNLSLNMCKQAIVDFNDERQMAGKTETPFLYPSILPPYG